ncbi:MAG: sugar phosphate isomerase/epimerase [Planctomycetia bacterium]|nr:sugar phosphate isomerase/epimerase [Planctomycetia bacterium]
MIRSSVTVSLVREAKGGPFVFWHDLPGACRTARSLGFDAVEIFPPGPDAVNPKELRELLNENGLALSAVGTGAGWVRHKLHLCLPDDAARDKARDSIRAIIDFAGPFGAPAIIGSMQGRHGDEVDQPTALGLLSDALEDLGEHARQYNVPLIFEPINRYESNLINSLDDGVRLLSPLSTKNVRLLADLFHMNIEEVDSAASLRAAGKLVGHVHFVDSNRRPAGMGHIDYAPIVTALEAIGYDRFASAEALSYPDPDSAARQTIETFRRYFRRK